MKVKQLIKELKKMPKNADVWHIWDGCSRTEIEIVYLAQSGDVMTVDFDQPVYDNEDRPIGAPDEDEDMNWHTKLREFRKGGRI